MNATPTTPAAPAFTQFNPPERKRVYLFPEGERLEFKDVKALAVSKSGNHRLELVDGRRFIVPYTWLAIELDIDQWTM